MGSYSDREAFIPYRRADLIEMCLADGQLSPAEGQQFREFCQILAAYYHFEFHQLLEDLKANFAPFNPDADTKTHHELSQLEVRQKEADLVKAFGDVLVSANYNPLTEAELQLAFDEETLVDLKTSVDFDDFEQLLCYHRGDVFKTTTEKKWFRTYERTVDVFERVALLLKFKDQAHFEAKGQDVSKFNFTPGKTYIYFYKNIPKYDLELLFPNIKVSMTLKDRLLFGIPAIGAAVPILLRALPQLLLVIGVVLFFLAGPSVAEQFGADREAVNNFMPVLAALLSLVVALGGFAFKQYTSYKNKQIKFQKSVTDTLFFRALDSNAGVFHTLIDSAEEEVTKEIILVYYHLLKQEQGLTADELDDLIESWMGENFETKIDFDIEDPLSRLTKISGPVGPGGATLALLEQDGAGRYQARSLGEAKTILDYVWDNFFTFHQGEGADVVRP